MAKGEESRRSFSYLLVDEINPHNDAADALWTHLDQLNQSLARTLLHLSKLHDQDPENYKTAVKYLSSLQAVQVGSLSNFMISLLIKISVECRPIPVST